MDIDYSRKEKFVGALTLAVFVLLIGTIVFVGRGQNWFKNYIVYYTTFNENYNLKPNAAVKMFKTDIGKVKDISLEENRVKVTLAILEDYAERIREGSIVSVESPTLIGDEYVSVKPGDYTRPPIPPQGTIDSVEKRSLTQLMEDVELEETFRMFVKALRDFSAIIQELRDPEGPLFASLKNINRILADLEAGKGTLGSVVKSRELIDRINIRLDQLGTILANIDRAAVKAPHVMDRVNQNLDTFQSLSDDVTIGVADIRRIILKVEDNIDQLKRILDDVEKGSRDIPPITRSTRDGIREIREGVKRIDRVFEAVEGNILIRSNLPSPTPAKTLDADVR